MPFLRTRRPLLSTAFRFFSPLALALSANLSAAAAAAPLSTMAIDQQNTIVISPPNPTAVVVFLHGLGDTAHGWASQMADLAKQHPHIKFILPTAAPRPVTIANGRSIPAWYDIQAFVGGAGYAEGIDLTRDLVMNMIAKEVEGGIPYSRIVLGGFSQGGATSYFTGFQVKQPLGGIIVLSSFIPREAEFAFAPETANVPLLICHGDADSRARYPWAVRSKQTLEAAGVKDITFHTYAGLDHTSSPAEMRDVSAWLQRVLPAQ